jgi:hypothetical protein
MDRQQVVVFESIKKWLINQRAGSDDPCNASFETCLPEASVDGELFAHGDEAFMMLHESLQVPVEVKERKPTHGNSATTPFTTSKLDIEQ